MTIRAKIEFLKCGSTYFTIHTSPQTEDYDVILESIWSLLSLLEVGNHKFDADVIELLTKRLEVMKDE